MAHTPKPWEIVKLNLDGPYAIIMPFNGEKTFYGIRGISRVDDAKLAVAAPDLLEACKATLDWINDYLPYEHENQAIKSQLALAIAKAESTK